MQNARRKALAAVSIAAAASMLLAACTAAAPEPTPVETTTAPPPAPVTPIDFPVALAFLPNVQYAGYWIADDSGLYEDAGLVTTFLPGGPNAPAPEVSITSGQALIATESNTSRLFSYLAKANDIVIIGQRMQVSPNGLLSLAARPVVKKADLTGSRIIAAAQNSASIEALMKINGVTDYTFVPGGADVGPLMAGQGDALLAFATNQPITLAGQGLVEGKDFFFTPFSDLNYYLMSEVVIVSRSFLEANRDRVVAFMAATIKGWEAQMADPTKGATLAVEKYGVDLGLKLNQQIATGKAEIPFMTSAFTKTNGLFAVDPTYIEKKVYPGLEAAGIANLPAVKNVVDTSIVADAWKLLNK